MSKRPRCIDSRLFKAKVALAASKGEKTLAELTQDYDLHLNQITTLLEEADGLFGSGKVSNEPAADVKKLHAKSGELTLPNDMLEGTLDKAGLLPSANR